MTLPRAGQQPATARHPEWGLRTRSVVAAVVVVTVALLMGTAVLLWVLSTSLTAAAEATLAAHVTDIAQLVSIQGLNNLQPTLQDNRRGGEIVQILDREGLVVATTDRRLTGPISNLRPAPGHSAHEEVPRLAALDDPDERLVAARGVAGKDRSFVVLASVSIQVQADSVRTVAWLLFAAIPLVVVLVAVSVWVLVGRSLATVDRIRGQVAEIDARRRQDRIGVPGTADEIAALAVTMNQMLDKLEAADRSQRVFFSDASHELRSPLSTLVTTAEVASLDPTGRTWIELQPTVLAETRRMRSLVEDLLTLAKVDSQSLQLSRDEVDVEDVLYAERRRIDALTDLTIVASLHPARVVGDERRLTQVFRNLIDNAVRHARSTVRLQMELTGNDLLVLVENDGGEIPVADRERVFDRFVRLDGSRAQDHGGSGLGLAIAREIVTAHDGTLKLTDATPGWCRFAVVLPLGEPSPVVTSEGARFLSDGTAKSLDDRT